MEEINEIVQRAASCFWESDSEKRNVVDALFNIGDGLFEIAASLNKLGLASASTPMGAIESLSFALIEGLGEIAQRMNCGGCDKC